MGVNGFLVRAKERGVLHLDQLCARALSLLEKKLQSHPIVRMAVTAPQIILRKFNLLEDLSITPAMSARQKLAWVFPSGKVWDGLIV